MTCIICQKECEALFCSNECLVDRMRQNLITTINTMKLIDCQIQRPNVNASDELCFGVKIKKEDWNVAMKELIYSAYHQGKTLDFEIVWLSENTDEDMIRKLRGDLGGYMANYCKESWTSLDNELQKLYTRNRVSSRTELTRAQLEEEIGRYKAWLGIF